MVQSFHRGVALIALQTTWTLVPADTFGQHFAIFGRVLEDLWWSAEVTEVVCVDTALTIVGVFFSGAPGGFIHKHVKDEAVFVQIEILEVVVQEWAMEKHVGDKVVFYAFVLKVAIDLRDLLQVLETEASQFVWLSAHVERNDKGSVKSIVAEKLQFLCVVVSGQRLFSAFHVKDVEVHVGTRVLNYFFAIGHGACLHGVEGCSVNAEIRCMRGVVAKHRVPSLLAVHENVLQIILLTRLLGDSQLVR